jgi:hypothetical protein
MEAATAVPVVSPPNKARRPRGWRSPTWVAEWAAKVGWIDGSGSERANKRRGRAERAEEGDKGPETNLVSSSIQKRQRCVVAYVL